MLNLIKTIEEKIAFYSINHKSFYELKKGRIGILADDLANTLCNSGYVKLALKPGDSVWYAATKKPVEYIVHFVGINSEYKFYNCHKKTSEYASDRSFNEDQIGKNVYLTAEEAINAINERKNKL